MPSCLQTNWVLTNVLRRWHTGFFGKTMRESIPSPWWRCCENGEIARDLIACPQNRKNIITRPFRTLNNRKTEEAYSVEIYVGVRAAEAETLCKFPCEQVRGKQGMGSLCGLCVFWDRQPSSSPSLWFTLWGCGWLRPIPARSFLWFTLLWSCHWLIPAPVCSFPQQHPDVLLSGNSNVRFAFVAKVTMKYIPPLSSVSLQTYSTTFSIILRYISSGMFCSSPKPLDSSSFILTLFNTGNISDTYNI